MDGNQPAKRSTYDMPLNIFRQSKQASLMTKTRCISHRDSAVSFDGELKLHLKTVDRGSILQNILSGKTYLLML